MKWATLRFLYASASGRPAPRVVRTVQGHHPLAEQRVALATLLPSHAWPCHEIWRPLPGLLMRARLALAALGMIRLQVAAG